MSKKKKIPILYFIYNVNIFANMCFDIFNWTAHNGLGGTIRNFFFFFFFVFLGLYSWHAEVPRLRVESELQLLACATATATPDQSHVCNLHHSSQQLGILNPLSEARNTTCTPMDASQIHFLWAMMETPAVCFCFCFF